MVRSTTAGCTAAFTVLLWLLAFPAVALTLVPSEVSPEEGLEIAVGEADAIVEGFVTGFLDTFIVTRRERSARYGRPETWIRVRVISKFKGPIGIGPGSFIQALVWPHGEDRFQSNRTRLVFLRRNEPGRFLKGIVPSSVPWVLSTDSRDVGTDRRRIENIVADQSRETLLREADMVVVARPSGEGRRCRQPEEGTCLTLAVDSVLAGRSPSRSIPISVRGFGIPPVPAIYFLRRSSSGRHVVVGKTAGRLEPPTYPPVDWYSRNAEIIRRQWHRLH